MIATATPQTALKYETQVEESGHINLEVPFSIGTRIVVFVIPQPDDTFELIHASESSLAFWDNDLDDEDWNSA